MFQPPASVEAKSKIKKTNNVPAVNFTEEELDTLLSEDAIDQEIQKMTSKDVLPSQKIPIPVTADVIESVRWQEGKEKELHEMKVSDSKGELHWVQDLIEDFVTFGLSPANTQDEAKVILENLDNDLKAQAEAGFGPEAREYISTLRKELELLIEKL
jgi:hypothetical protein